MSKRTDRQARGQYSREFTREAVRLVKARQAAPVSAPILWGGVSALLPVGPQSAIFILKGDQAQLRELEVAAHNGMEAWVKSGLVPGTQVIVYPDNKLRNGDRVATRAVNHR